MKLELASKAATRTVEEESSLGSTHHLQQCVMLRNPCTASGAPDSVGGLDFDQHDAGFSLWHDGGRACAHLNHRRRGRRRSSGPRQDRRRNNNGWDMSLVVECDATGGEVDYVVQTVDFARSATNMKCILLLPTHTHTIQYGVRARWRPCLEGSE